MKRAGQVFDAEQQDKVNHAVAQAEAKTAAEIVPVVASISGRYDRAEDTFGIWTGVSALAVAWGCWQYSPWLEFAWGGLLVLVLALLGGFMLGAIAGTRFPSLCRPFVPRAMMRDEVFAQAQRLFCDQRIYRTAGGTGVLIYVSLYERTAAIVADATVTEKLGEQALNDLCRLFASGMRRGGPAADAFCAVIEAAGQRLMTAFPRAENDRNELPNRLVVLN